METEIHTQRMENGKARRKLGRQKMKEGGKVKIQEGNEEMDKSEGDELTDTQRREGGDPGRIGEMGAQTDRKGEVGGSLPRPSPTPTLRPVNPDAAASAILASTFPCGTGAAPPPATARSGGVLMVPGAPSVCQGLGRGVGAALGYP